ncbi:M1 family metallopeptidase [Pedobacter sp. MC2016-15]|uniref:M1 family metallopeptidase n=1 Tax=Pedobacter sp. MC2016-15 TaxID=2994473 RepID=UPI002246E84A|nr:M1 family metallopeptidase [Pedobacter sp. MC2016-15]MCX2480672.1 M1 family metallopeptidase [Pedobacter sp. MC2016-15]
MNKLILVSLISTMGLSAFGQQSLPVPATVQQAYTKGTRDISGRPGAKYWQNTADYDLKVSFDPSTRILKGTVAISYKNQSPDVLKELWFKLYPNLYKKGVPRTSKIAEKDQNEGVVISAMELNGKTIDASAINIDGTNMHTAITPLAPGATAKLNISYQYTVNKGSHTRTGQVDEGAFFIAYFFPRIAVYDDIDGWNKFPYLGDAEFYNDFCNFKAAVTVPGDYVLWATGDLTNTKSVFNPAIAGKIALAEKVDSVVNVISPADLASGKITSGKGSQTWKFEAENVTDFVFALSNHYLWKSSSLVVDPKTNRRTRVDAAFNASHKDYYEVIDFARKTVEAMSYQFPKWPFPYQHETVFDGLDQMEYPMMVNDNPTSKREDAITLTDHEIFHTMFPFYMGINETKYGWMDEGWATIGEWTISPMIDSSIVDDYGISATSISSGTSSDTPIMTLTPDLKGVASFTNSYPKPGLGYLYIKDYLGDELFTKALHHYIEQWHGKHPMPFDFFYSMNEGAGKNMDWFWKRWFFEGGVNDLGLVSAEKTGGGYTIKVENKGGRPLPVDLNLTYSDNSTQKLHQSVGVWELGEKVISVPLTTTKKLKRITLGSSHVPDKFDNNNFLNVR